MLPMINSKAEHTQTGEAMKEKDTQSTFLSEASGELYKTKCSFRCSKSVLCNTEAACCNVLVQTGFALSIK